MTATADPKKPVFGGRRLLVVVAGSVNAVHLPYWLTWLRTYHPDVDTRVIATRSAQRFITLQALSVLTSHQAISDAWPDDPLPTALHVELTEWADSVLVYPASLHYVSRAALGLADSPSLLVVHAATCPVAIAPALPPGVEENPIHTRNIAALESRRNVTVLPTQPGTSVTTGRRDGRSAPPLWTALRALEDLRREMAAVNSRELSRDHEISVD